MATMADLRHRTRLEIGDHPEFFRSSVEGDGSSTIFDLPQRMLGAELNFFHFSVDGNRLPDLVPEEVDRRAGLVFLTDPLPSGNVMVVRGYHYKNFLDDEIELFINSAFERHTYDHPVVKVIGDLPQAEVILVALLASIEALEIAATDASYDINLTSPEGVSLPRGQRVQQLWALIGEKERLYREISLRMNVGEHRIEMRTLRRVSRTTGRLVPVIQPQEIDDIRRPMDLRVYPAIDIQGPQERPSYLPSDEETTE